MIIASLKEKLYGLSRWAEKYTKTDMVYLLRTGFWGNAGIITSSLFGLGLYVIFGHYLTQEQYGFYQYLLTLSVFINAFTLTGMNAAVTRSVARGFEGTLRSSVRIQLLWAVVPFLLASAGALYYFFNGDYVLAGGLLILGIFTPIANAFNTYASYLAGKLEVRRAFIYNFAGNVPYYGGIALCAIFFNEALPILIANCVLNTLVLYVAYRTTLRTQKPNSEVDPEARRYGSHLSIMNVPLIILGSLDGILAFHFLGPAGLAFYSFATAIPDQMGKFLKFLPSAALPKFAVSDESALRSSMARKLFQVLGVSVLLAGIYLVMAPLLFNVLFPQYVEVVPYSQLYAISLLLLGSSIVTTALIAKQRVRDLYFFNISSSVAQTVIQLFGVMFWGLAGLIIGKIIGGALAFIAVSILFFVSKPKVPENTGAAAQEQY
ncbi:MAG: hypothetical protein V4644_03270 [Patescibacteria group bacterium]